MEQKVRTWLITVVLFGLLYRFVKGFVHFYELSEKTGVSSASTDENATLVRLFQAKISGFFTAIKTILIELRKKYLQ